MNDFTIDSDRSFVVMKDNSGRINIYRARNGSIWETEDGLQETNNVLAFLGALRLIRKT